MDTASVASILVDLFQEVTTPPISLWALDNLAGSADENDVGTLRIPDEFSINIDGTGKVYDVFRDIDAFHALPVLVKKGILDTLYLLLRRGTYDVIRFRCNETIYPEEKGIISLLLDILGRFGISADYLSLSKRIIRLLGILCVPSILPAELRRFLSFLRTPSFLANSLLHALKNIIRQDDSIVKAAPVAFFNFGGSGSGLYARQMPDFFKQEFQICMWLRIESFTKAGHEGRQIVSCVSDEDNKYGFQLLIWQKKIVLEVLKGSDVKQKLEVDHFQIRKGVWYNLVIAHSKTRFALYNQSKIAIRIDGTQLFEQSISLSDSAPGKNTTGNNKSDALLIFGKDFDGQMGAIYFFLDAPASLPYEAIEVIMRLNAKMQSEGGGRTTSTAASIDLEPIFVSSGDGKQVSVTPNILAVYHPCRMSDRTALDVHGGRHASLGEGTYSWSMKSARDVMVSLGGISCLLPLFPRLLIENDQRRNIVAQESDGNGLGSPLGDVYGEVDCYQYLGETSIEVLSIDKIEVSDEGCIGLLLSIISRCVQGHESYLQDFASVYGIGMIEYALSNVSDRILASEGDSCAVALLELKQVVGGHPLLENSAIKHLMSNFKVWSKASVFFQKSLISILHSAVADQPDYFIRTVGVQWFLDQILYFIPTPVVKDSVATTAVGPMQAIEPTETSPNRRKRFGSIFVSASQKEGSDSVLNDFRQAAISSGYTSEVRADVSVDQQLSSPKVSPKLIISRFRLALNKDMDEGAAGATDQTSTSPISPFARSTIEANKRINKENDNLHKFYMRNNFYSILYILVQNDLENKELESMFSFMDKCKDTTVLNEVCQLLLCFIVEMNSAAIQQIISACSSPEGFTSFVVFRLISSPSEEVRSSAIRLLTHFYQRLGETSAPINKGTNMSVISQVFEVHKNRIGINALEDSGHLFLLSKMLENKWCADSSLLTYSALLEMLVTVHGSAEKLYTYADSLNNSENAGKLSKNGALRVFALSPFNLSQLPSGDDQEGIINGCLLTHVFNIIPRLNDVVEDSLFVDFMTILKHRPENRDAFCAHLGWSQFFFQLSSRYVTLNENEDLRLLRSDDLLPLLRSWAVGSGGSAEMSSSPMETKPSSSSLTIYIHDEKDKKDLRFAMCMKLNSTLMVHSTGFKNGWLLLMRTLMVMMDSPEKHILSQAMLSHSINELTFGMDVRFKALLSRVVSDTPAVKQDAYDQLENFLVLVIVVSIHGLNFPISVVDNSTSHTWRYLNLNDIKPDLVNSHDTAKHLRELIHPLDRDHSIDHGRLVLVLQCLRFFDILFPATPKTGLLSNGQILKYRIRHLDKQSSLAPGRERLSLLGAVIRMSLFVLKEMCPLGEMADINVMRLSHIVRTVDVIPLKSGAENESWLLVILHFAFQHMKKMKASLEPLFEEFGLPVNANCLSDTGAFDASCKRRDEENYDAILNDYDQLSRLELLLDSKIGCRLISYVCHLVQLLIDLFKKRSDVLYSILGDKIFLAYSNFVQFAASDQLSGSSRRTSPMRRRLSSSLAQSETFIVKPNLNSSSEGLERDDDDWMCGENITAVGESSSTPFQHTKDVFLCDDVISTFRYLRDPFFLLDLSAIDAIQQSFAVVEIFESKCLFDFNEDLLFLKSHMKAKETGPPRAMGPMPTWSSSARVQRIAEMNLAKSVAESWQSCLKIFEAEWSPWHGEEDEERKCFELSRHVDRYSRRFVLTRASELPNYSDAIYYSIKRGQTLVGSSRKEPSAILPNLLAPSSFLKSALKLSLDPRKRNIAEDWGTESSFISEENALTAQSLRPQWALSFEWSSDEWIVYSSEASQVCLEYSVSGALLLTNKHLYFNPRKQMDGITGGSSQSKNLKTRRWALEFLSETHARRHFLKNCGIELFFLKSPEVFFAFNSLKELQTFFFTLRRQSVPNLTSPPTLNPRQVAERLKLDELWRKRHLSNFEYLMALNKMAGRSFNDLSQYPVFPWIIADYTSEKLNLDDPRIYRDLSKPIGALNENRLAEIMERYNNSFDDVDVPKFMYGSHYSSAGVVLHYLLRQEPFTAMAVSFQGGKFDCPDRLFFDFSSSWESLNTSVTDVKELIPEFFCCPEILLNTNSLPLGPLQTGVEVNDVILPPWAKDAFDFVRINREALESDYVSENLCHWIDLIFGYKQTGEAAVDARNVFHYLTYENAVNIDGIADAMEREATISQVVNFGQTPSQLFTRPHLQRLLREEVSSFSFGDQHLIGQLNLDVVSIAPETAAAAPIINIQSSKTQLVAYHADFSVSYFKIASTQDSDFRPQLLRHEKTRMCPGARLSIHCNRIIKKEISGRFQRELSRRLSRKDKELDTDFSSDEAVEAAPRTLMGKIGNILGIRSNDINVAPTQGNASPSLKLRLRSSQITLCNHHIALSVLDGAAGRIISCGYLDDSIRVHSLETLKEIASTAGIKGHVGGISCIQLDKQAGDLVISGGRDGTCRVWLLEISQMPPSSYYNGLKPRSNNDAAKDFTCLHVLCGHQAPVTAIYYSTDLDVLFSGSEDGRLCLHSGRKGEFIRLINTMDGIPVDIVFITAQGYLLSHSWSLRKLWLFWVNGEELGSKTEFLNLSTGVLTQERINSFATSGPDSNVLVCGCQEGSIFFLSIPAMESLRVISNSPHGPCRCLCFSEDSQYLMAGYQDGSYTTVSFTVTENSKGKLKSVAKEDIHV